MQAPEILAVHADWSIAAPKRWMSVALRHADRWQLAAPEPVGPVGSLLPQLLARAAGGPVVLGVDCPLGLPRGFARRHAGGSADFPAFLRGLRERPGFFEVCTELAQAGAARPFYPARPRAGMRRAELAAALGLADAAALNRACDLATAERPAGAPPFWTLGANQSGKAAISFWRDVLVPALHAQAPPLLWPFDGPLRAALLPGRVVVAETYPAQALRLLGLRLAGSKRRQADRAALAPALLHALSGLDATAPPGLQAEMTAGFGADAAGEDRFDSFLGLLNVIAVLSGAAPDTAPADSWISRWEGWVLGQSALPRLLSPPGD